MFDLEKRYKTILADPPWSYENKRTGGGMRSGSCQKYRTMSVDEICQLPICNISGKDSILFLWATVPLIQYGFQVLDAWGYKYKTMIVWRKTMSWGMGFWFRGQCELCLLGIKGKVKPFRYQKANFIQAKVGKHSEKPQEFYDFIEPVCVNPKLELFATKPREGWDCLGLEIDGNDICDILSKGEKQCLAKI